MRDVELYRAILGLTPPWTVVSVELDVTGQRVVVQVDAGGGPFACPECGTAVRKPAGERIVELLTGGGVRTLRLHSAG